MIDIENEIYTGVRNAVKKKHPKCSVSGASTSMPAEFPAVAIEETDNYAYKKSVDGASNENHAILVYTIKVWSKDRTDKKAEAKAILQTVDNYFNELGFRRKSSKHFEGEDGVTYRATARYDAVVSQDHKVFRR